MTNEIGGVEPESQRSRLEQGGYVKPPRLKMLVTNAIDGFNQETIRGEMRVQVSIRGRGEWLSGPELFQHQRASSPRSTFRAYEGFPMQQTCRVVVGEDEQAMLV